MLKGEFGEMGAEKGGQGRETVKGEGKRGQVEKEMGNGRRRIA